jgi:hypothetical protein
VLTAQLCSTRKWPILSYNVAGVAVPAAHAQGGGWHQ